MAMHSSHFLPVSVFHLIFNALSDDCEGVRMMWVMPFPKHRESSGRADTKDILGQYKNQKLNIKELPLYFHITLC